MPYIPVQEAILVCVCAVGAGGVCYSRGMDNNNVRTLIENKEMQILS